MGQQTMASETKRAKQDFSQTFYEKLICYICESRLSAGKHHWYRCLQGHMICQDCREVKETKKCSCAKSIPLQYCQIIEALLNADKMQFKCENLTRGCQETKEKEDMILHQTECIYRLVKCPRVNCESKVPFHKLLVHMKPDCLLEGDLLGLYNECTYTNSVKIVDASFRPKKIIAKTRFSFLSFGLKMVYFTTGFISMDLQLKQRIILTHWNTTTTPKHRKLLTALVIKLSQSMKLHPPLLKRLIVWLFPANCLKISSFWKETSSSSRSRLKT